MSHIMPIIRKDYFDNPMGYAMPKRKDEAQLIAQLTRLGYKVKAPQVKKTFSVSQPVLERFMRAVEKSDKGVGECVDEALLEWLSKRPR